MKGVFLATAVVLSAMSFPAAAKSPAQQGMKASGLAGLQQPERSIEDAEIQTVLRRPTNNLRGYTELLPYVMAAPDQLDAGSCLYMSLTGIAEWWLARLNPTLSREPDGPVDLSERYLMNLSGSQSNKQIRNWITDSIFLFNKAKGSYLNRDYRFTKGWYREDDDGDRTAAARGSAGASYDETYNWIDETERLANAFRVKLPRFRREVLFADPEEDQWNTGVMPANIVEKIKAALVTNKAPVQVIYNHFGYWHANYIVGFDDEAENQNCRFVQDYLEFNDRRPGELRREAAANRDEDEREALLGQARLAEKTRDRTAQAFRRGGGCHPRGVFFVRDSIYPDLEAPLYDYDPKNVGEEKHYTKKIVVLEYDWVRYMGNHAIQILAE